MRGLNVSRASLVGLVAVALGASSARAATLLVPAQYPTIQAAVNAAANGDEVVIAAGTYTGAGNVDVDLLGKAIVVRSASGAATCVIDCQQAGRAFYLHTGETVLTVIQDLTVRNGGSVNEGGAIFCDQASASILGCVFSDNAAQDGGAIAVVGGFPEVVACSFRNNVAANIGGGISVYSGGGVFNSCTFEGNDAGSWGGGMALTFSTGTSRYNTFDGNTCGSGWGGGLTCIFDTTYSMHHSTFVDNVANQGGGLFVRQSYVTAFRCDFEDNQATEGGGIFLMNPYNTTPAELTVDSCGFTGNSATSTGGGIHAMYYANALVSKSDFYRNTAEDRGGAIHFGSKLDLFVTNSRFGDNSADWGGAVSHHGDDYDGNPAGATYVNSTFVGNTAALGGAAVFNDLATTVFALSSATLNGGNGVGTLYNTALASSRVVSSIVWRNRAGSIVGPGFAVAYTDVEGGYPGTGNLNANPLFTDANGADNVAGNADDDLRLLALSPCRDAGLNTGIPADEADLDFDLDVVEPTPVDLDLNPRIANGTVDMGAYEAP